MCFTKLEGERSHLVAEEDIYCYKVLLRSIDGDYYYSPYYQYKYNSYITENNGFSRTQQPVGVIEVTVTDVERFKASDGSFESVTASITANWGLDEVCHSDTFVRGMVDYTRWGER